MAGIQLLLLFSIMATLTCWISGCEIPENREEDIGLAYQCFLDNKDNHWCIVPCTLDSLKMVDDKGFPDAKVVEAQVASIPDGEDYVGFKKMISSFVVCVKKHGAKVDPKDREKCLSYVGLGTCFRTALHKECPDLA